MDSGKNFLFLLLILIILITAFAIILVNLKTDAIKNYLSTDKILKVLLVIEDDTGMPISSNILAYYPETKRAAMFDIPANTGLIIQTLNRTDGIGEVYFEKGITSFKAEIEKLTGISVPFYITCSVSEFAILTDMLSGLSVFIPTPIDINTETERILLPSGSVNLDGDKMRDYLTYESDGENETESASRKQKAFLAMFRAINDRSPDIFLKDRFSIIKNNFHSNLIDDDFKNLIETLSKMDMERLVPQRVTGSTRLIEGKKLLFPFRDGQQLKDVIRQAIAVLASDDTSVLERIYALEILNGTGIQGLAKNTSELYQSFGYDVVNIGNADGSVEKTILIDRIGNPSVAKIAAQIIRCKNIQTAKISEGNEDYGSETNVDFTLILGHDFNGYSVIGKRE